MTRATGFSFGMLWLFTAACTPEGASVATRPTGQIEADEIDVASRLAARIIKVMVNEGQRVKAGDILVKFEDDVIEVKRRRAIAGIKAAESQKDIAQNATRPEEIEQAKAAMEASLKQMEFAKSVLDRMEKLIKEDAISQVQFDDTKFKFDSAKEKYEADKARYQMAVKGAREEQKVAAGALVEQAETQLEEVEAYNSDLNLAAPVDGEVLQILSHEGELVPAGYPVVTLVRTQAPWAVFHIKETMLKQFTIGQLLKVDIPSLSRTVDAKVNFITPQGSYATLVTTQDRSAFDLKTFEVRATLAGDLKDVRPGMTAVAAQQ